MSNVFLGYAQIATTGVRVASGAASAGGTTPNNSAGNLPRYVRITATAAAHIRFGTGGSVTAVNTDVMVQPGDPLVMAVLNCDKFAVIQETAGGFVVVTPLENS